MIRIRRINQNETRMQAYPKSKSSLIRSAAHTLLSARVLHTPVWPNGSSCLAEWFVATWHRTTDSIVLNGFIISLLRHYFQHAFNKPLHYFYLLNVRFNKPLQETTISCLETLLGWNKLGLKDQLKYTLIENENEFFIIIIQIRPN